MAVGDALTENVATKADLDRVESALRAEVKAALKTDIAELRVEVIITHRPSSRG